MSSLSRLAQAAQAASDYMRKRLTSELAAIFRGRNSSRNRQPDDDDVVRYVPPVIRGGLLPGSTAMSGGGGSSEPPITGNAPIEDDGDDGEIYDDVTLIGRDDTYDDGAWQQVNARMRVVASSNVYGYSWQQSSPSMGILYVQFLNWTPRQFGGDGGRNGPGPVYAYYDVPTAKFREFEGQAAASAGGAVWDYLRVRGSMFEHQHAYRLVSTSGEYVPRKVTAKGFKARNPARIGTGLRQPKLNQGGGARQQLAPREVAFRRVLPARPPYRGAPNRGTPNRGR